MSKENSFEKFGLVMLMALDDVARDVEIENIADGEIEMRWKSVSCGRNLGLRIFCDGVSVSEELIVGGDDILDCLEKFGVTQETIRKERGRCLP